MDLKAFKACLILVFALLGLCEVPSRGDGLYGGAGSPLFCSSTEPTVFVGYFGQSTTPTVSLETEVRNGLTFFTHRLPVEGIWTEVVLPIKGSGCLGLILGGGWLFSFPRVSESTYALSGSQVARSWQTSTQWYSCRAALTYDIRPSITLISGVRFDDFLATSTDPKSVVGSVGTSTDTASIEFGAYMPFFGAMLRGSHGDLQANLGITACPVLWGAVRYVEAVSGNVTIAGSPFPVLFAANEFRSGGYFLETFADCSLPMGYINLGAFFKMDIFSGNNTVRFGNNIIASPPIAYPKVDFRLSLEIRNWIVGGQVGVPF